MTLLSFAKPKKERTFEEHERMYASDSVPGTYVPNMSLADRLRWKAKLVGTKSGNHQIEIRSEEFGSNVLIIVNGACKTRGPAPKDWKARHKWNDLEPFRVKLSTNGPMYLHDNRPTKLASAIEEAQKILAILDAGNTEAIKTIRNGGNPLESP